MRTQTRKSSGPLEEVTTSPGSGSFLPGGMLVPEVTEVVWEQTLLSGAPSPVPSTKTALDASPSTLRTWLLFVF